MRFSVDHELPGSVTEVADVLLDPDFQTQLELPDLSLPEVVESTTSGTTSSLRLRYEFTGKVDPIVNKLMRNKKLTWVQEFRLDRATGRGQLTFAAELDPKRLFGSADMTLEAVDDDETHRHIRGELHVKVPVIGGSAEKKIVPGLVRRLDVEAAEVAATLKARG
jgi:hypothetical protein